MAESKKEQIVREWSSIAGETVNIEIIGGVLYAFCSELGALRLKHKMNIGHAGLSLNRKTWFYTTDKSL